MLEVVKLSGSHTWWSYGYLLRRFEIMLACVLPICAVGSPKLNRKYSIPLRDVGKLQVSMLLKLNSKERLHRLRPESDP